MGFPLGFLVLAVSTLFVYQATGLFLSHDGLKGRLKILSEFFHSNPLYPASGGFRIALAAASVLSGSGCFSAAWIVLGRFLLAIPAGLVGASAPLFFRKLIVSRRRHLFERQLAEALSLMASSLKSGVSFPQALETLSRESRLPLARELQWVVEEHRLGKPLSVVLEAWSRRIRSRSLTFVVSAISVAQVTGGSLAAVLQNVAAMIRQSEQLKERAHSLSAQGKLSGYVVGAMPFALMGGIGLMAPETISPLFTTNTGNILFIVVCILVGIGLCVIHRMVDIEV